MKGAEETNRQMSGNDCDQATLLSALLRASGFPTRYVKGTMEFFKTKGEPIEKAKNILGIEDPSKIAEYLQKAGIPYKTVISGGKVSNYQVEHIWIETQIPYGNYRGAIIDDSDKHWLGLDTSIKQKGYTYNTPADIFEQSSISDQLSGIRDEYLGTSRTQTPLEYFKERLSTLGNQQADNYKRTKTLKNERLKIVPASMQITQKNMTNEYTEIPDELKHKVKLKAVSVNSVSEQENSGQLFEITINTMNLSNHRIAITYEPETVEDQEIIASYGGIDNTPAYLVRLRPVLTVNGERIVVAQDGLQMGSEYNLTIELISPNTTESITNTHIVGNLSVIGIVSQKAISNQQSAVSESSEAESSELTAEGLLYEEAINYISRWNDAEDELASLFHLVISRPIPTVITIGGMIDVTYLLDTPHGFEWKGEYIDANLRAIETAFSGQQSAISTEERKKLFMQLSALQGSVLEYRIFEDDWGVESVSTANLFQTVSTQQSAISNQLLTIDKTNIASILPTLTFDDNIEEDIQNSVNQNFKIQIPNSEIQYEDWTGIGYIKENTETGEAGYMLSGMTDSTSSLSGGMTADKKEDWINQDLANTLSNPYSKKTNKDSESAVKIVRLNKESSDYQDAIVDSTLSTLFEVMALDKDSAPVKDVKITFKVTAGGGKVHGVDKNGTAINDINTNTTTAATSITIKTGDDGIARAKLTLGEKTSDSPYYKEYTNTNNEKYMELVGINYVSVNATTNTKGTFHADKSFEAYGKPAEANNIEKVSPTSDTYGDPNVYAGTVWLKVVDEFGNPISNKNIKISVKSEYQGGTKPEGMQNAKLYSNKEDCPDMSTLDCPSAKEYDSQNPLSKNAEYYGALAYVILGNTENTKYTVTVNAKKDTIDTNTLKRTDTGTDLEKAQFTFYTYTYTGEEAEQYLSITSVYAIDEKGNKIDAGAAGNKFSEDIKAAVHYTEENYEKAVKENCTSDCYYLKGKGTFTTTAINDGKVQFTVTEGGGSVTPTTQTTATDGHYSTTLTLGQTPAKNIIEETATATKKEVPTINPSTGEITKTEKQLTSSTAYEVWGVKATVEPNQTILINEDGYPVEDTTIKYKVEPADYAYAKQSLWIDFYEKDKDGNESWMGLIQADTNGNLILSQSGAKFNTENTYNIELIINRGTKAEIRSEKVQINVGNLYIEKEDSEFQDTKLRWNDYYPALGEKTITVRSTLEKKEVKCEVLSPAQATCTIFDEQKITNGKMRFKLSGTTLAPSTTSTTGVDEIKLKFSMQDQQTQQAVEATYNVKNNSNTTLSEVLSGEAVFVYDESTDENHAGKTESTVTNDDDRKLDYIQELLNQVVPRKRSVTGYTLMEEDGAYDSYTYNRLIDFKTNFNLNINDTVGSYTSGAYGSSDNTSSTFRKLMKDYGKRREGNTWLIDGANNDSWLYKVIDKETLVGNTERIPASTESLSSDSADSLINKTANNTRNDTGLYELYKNVVERFMSEMIEQADYYSGDRGTSGVDAPTDNWRSRNNYGSAGCTNTNPACAGGHGNGMSYCYGCKDDINGFNTTVANCQAESTTAIRNRETDSTNGNEYRGNIGTNCAVGSGSLDWAGLTRDEYNLGLTPFSASYWAGIDCSGFVQRTVENSENVVYSLISLTIPSPPDWISSQEFFTDNSRVMYLTNPQSSGQRISLQKKLKRGDLVRYDGHISMIYSEKPSCDAASCSYEIIHAYGGDRNGLYTYPRHDTINAGRSVFGRKVIRTWENIGTPSGFGRIKFWD